MKKFYLLFAFLFFSFASFALMPIQLKPADIKVKSGTNRPSKAVDFSKFHPLTDEQKANLPSLNTAIKANAPQKAVTINSTEWKQLEGARCKDPFLTVFGSFIPEFYNVDLYQNIENESLYAIDSPLKHSQFNGLELLSTSSKPYYYLASLNTMEINAEDEDLVYAYPVEVATVNSSYQNNFGGSSVQFVNIAGLNIQKEGKDKDKSHYGYLENNVITFPSGTMYIYIDGEAAGVYSDDYSIALPEGKIYATSVYPTLVTGYDDEGYITDYDFTTCTTGDDDLMIYWYDIAGDVENVALAFVPAYLTPSEYYYKTIAPNYVIDGDTESGYYIMKPKTLLDYIFSQYGTEVVTHLAYSMVTFAYDDEGNYIPNSGSVIQLMHQPDESDYYQSIGKGKITEGFFNHLFDTDKELSAEVEIEESIFEDDKGYIRVVNPFNNIYPRYIDSSHNHYMYMNLRVQDSYPITVETSATGLNLGYGYAMISSLSYEYMGYDISSIADQVYATYDEETNTVTFPENSLLFSFPKLYKGDWMSGNTSGSFKLQLPEGYSPAGVKDVIADSNDNAPIEYFNLQGIKIANPTPGQLIIKRQGTRTTKFTAR